MKVIALSTAAVAAAFIILSLIIRAALYYFTKDSLEEVDPDNYLDYPKDPEDDDIKTSPAAEQQAKEDTPETTSEEAPKEESHPTSTAVEDAEEEIKQTEENTDLDNKRSTFSKNNQRR